MRIGRDELEVMGLLDEDDGLKKDRLRERFNPDGDKTVRLSQVLRSLTEKELIAKYAQISTGRLDWEHDSWGKDRFGNDAVLMKKTYDGKMSKGPVTKIYLGLTERGRKELRKREGRLQD